MVLANHWEAWALAAAFEDAPTDALVGALDHALERARQGYPQRHRPRLIETRRFLIDDLAGAPLTEDTEIAGTTVLTGGPIPSVVEGRVVLLAGAYRFKDAVRVPDKAELWIQRGATLQPAGKDARIHVTGALRIFGATGETVTIGGKREWRGMEYESDVHHALADVLIHGAREGIALNGSRMHMIDSVVRDCGIGIAAKTYNVWCESVAFTDNEEIGIVQRRGGGDSFLRNCIVRGNGVGVRVRDEGVLNLHATEFRDNDLSLMAITPVGMVVARQCNFLDRSPLELHPGRRYDFRQNYWGAKKPNMKRKVRFTENKKVGDALLEPVLEKEAAAGIPSERG